MSLSLFETYSTNPALLQIYTDDTAAITGSGSLLITNTTAAYRWGNVTSGQTIVRGLTSGRLRGQFLIEGIAGGGSEFRGGLCCMQSQHDMASGGACYGFNFQLLGGTGGAYRVELWKYLNGLDTNFGSQLTASGGGEWSLGTLKMLEAEWQVSGNSVVLTLRTGNNPNFSDLSDRLKYTDVSSPLLTSVNEGIQATAFNTQFDMRVDTYTIARA